MKVPRKNSITKIAIRLYPTEFKKLVYDIDFQKENINDTDNSNKNYKIQTENKQCEKDKKVNKVKIRVKRGVAIYKCWEFSVCVGECMNSMNNIKKGLSNNYILITSYIY